MGAVEPTNATTPPRRAWIGAVVLFVAVAATFGNALQNEFVYDDQLLIVDDPAVRLPLSAGFEGLYYRPLRTLSYRLDHTLGGMEPWIFHLSNVVYHAGTTLLVHRLLSALACAPSSALLGTLVFAVHPVQADAVTYASGRRDVLCGLFYVLGLVAYLRHRRTGEGAWLALTGVAYVLALLAKEMAVTLPVACLLLDRWRVRSGEQRGSTIERRWWRAAFGVVVLLGVLTLFVAYGGTIGRVARSGEWYGGGAGATVATVLRVWVKYVQLVVWPGTLSADYSYDAFPASGGALDPRALASAVLLALLAAVGWARWRRGGRAGLGLAWSAVALLPVSHVIPIRELLAEHYLYVPMIGIALVASDLVDLAVAWRPARWSWTVATASVVVAALAARTVVRNRDWRDRLTLWSATVAVAPRCARAQYNLGQALFERTRLAEAERAWRAAAELVPRDRATQRGLAALDHRFARYDAAAARVDALLAVNAKDADTLMLAGAIALDSGRPARAREYFDAALALLPPTRAEQAQSGRARALERLAAPRPPGVAPVHP